MLSTSLRRWSLIVLALLPLAHLTGCATAPEEAALADTAFGYAGSVSAREYGYVRPASDVVVAGRRHSLRRGSSSDLWSRVRAGMRLDLHADARIDSKLASFRRDPYYLARLARSGAPYLPLIVAEIERRGFPMELALLPHVESRFNPAATSPKAAAGMWQFMPYTAREMGLRLDGGVDERRDVVASTRAALDYLEQLNRRFDGDWELAMAAYNCGPGCVAAAQAANRRRGQPTDFWSLPLPRETRDYVPQILAAARLVAESSQHAQALPVIPDRLEMEMIRSSEPMDLVALARGAGVSAEQLRLLNPGVQTAARQRQRLTHLMVPAGRGARIARRSPQVQLLPLTSSQTSARLATRARSASAPDRATRTTRSIQTAATEPLSERVHIVKTGETLASVALSHGLTIKRLAEWNGMATRDPLLPGQTLKIPQLESSPARITHRVRQGDSLSTIARRYGVTVTDLQRWNRIADNRLKPGETLSVYRRASASSI